MAERQSLLHVNAETICIRPLSVCRYAGAPNSLSPPPTNAAPSMRFYVVENGQVREWWQSRCVWALMMSPAILLVAFWIMSRIIHP